MSGGSWEYFYSRLDEVAQRLRGDSIPIRRAFGLHLESCALALKDIEWVDSGDWQSGHEDKAIRLAMGEGVNAAVLVEATKNAEKALAELHVALGHIETR